MSKTNVINIAAWVAVLISFAILIWGFDKGFNLADGGFNVLRYQNIQPNYPLNWRTEHILVKLVIPSSFRSIVGLRYISFLLNLLGSLLFAWSIARIYQKIHGHRISLAVLSIMMLSGFIMSYPLMPSELSYNSINQFFLISATALLILSIINEGKMAFAYSALAGVASGLVFLTKFPSGIALSIIASIVLILSPPQRIGRLAAFWGSCVIPLILMLLYLKPDINGYWSELNTLLSSKSHYNSSMFIASITTALLLLLKVFGLSLLISAAFWFAARNKHKMLQHTLFWNIGLLLITIFYSAHIDEHRQGFDILSMFFMMTIFLMFDGWILTQLKTLQSFSHLWRWIKPYLRYFPVFLLLIAVPYIGAFGSLMKLDWISKFYFISFMGLIALLLPFQKNKVIRFAVFAFPLYLIVIGLYQYVQYPLADGPLYKQTDYYKGVRYNPETANFYKSLEAILKSHGFTSEQGMIVTYVAPGLVYLMGSYQPGGLLWDESYHAEYFHNLKQVTLTHKPVVTALINELNADFKSGFYDATGLSIDNDYQVVITYNQYDRDYAYVYIPYSPEYHVQCR